MLLSPCAQTLDYVDVFGGKAAVSQGFSPCLMLQLTMVCSFCPTTTIKAGYIETCGPFEILCMEWFTFPIIAMDLFTRFWMPPTLARDILKRFHQPATLRRSRCSRARSWDAESSSVSQTVIAMQQFLRFAHVARLTQGTLWSGSTSTVKWHFEHETLATYEMVRSMKLVAGGKELVRQKNPKSLGKVLSHSYEHTWYQ